MVDVSRKKRERLENRLGTTKRPVKREVLALLKGRLVARGALARTEKYVENKPTDQCLKYFYFSYKSTFYRKKQVYLFYGKNHQKNDHFYTTC